eukprot:TRINITY_DN16659_c0_g1_i1.p1 TRINITY_DN16659_c0_g1~~TRINITY_DN16659_c0_g1_i1.p1  ORF type:complete len:880 (-),score=108.99 TRINITY_DN16659_c0_g1_i1:223-2811(-)
MTASLWTSDEYVAWTCRGLQRLVLAYNGWLSPGEISRLYEKNPHYKEVVQASGGLRRFCASHPEMFTWVSGNGLSYDSIQIPATRANASVANGRGTRNSQGDQPSVESKKKRVPRLAASFAGCLSDYISERFVRKDELWDAWSAFCTAAAEPESGFGSAIYFLVRWRVLARAGQDRFRVVEKTTNNFKTRRPMDRDGALEGVRPQFYGTLFASPVPAYDMPRDFLRLMTYDVYDMQRRVEKMLIEDKGLVPKHMDGSIYCGYQHQVLFAEELQMKYDISLYDLYLEEKLQFDRRTGLYRIDVPGLAEKRPSVLCGDVITLTCKQGKFVGYVHKVFLEHVTVSFHSQFRNNPPLEVHFSFTRTPLRVMHRAVDELGDTLMRTDGFPRGQTDRHRKLNNEQSAFLSAALQQVPAQVGALPMLLWGPPGTGKTTTLVETIFAILRKQKSAKILVCAPSNPAADLLCERLADLGVTALEMFRLVSFMRSPHLIPSSIKNYTQQDSITGHFICPPLNELYSKRIIVSTCTSASYIRSRFERETDAWFTHVFVDEAAQAMEAEVLVPLTLVQSRGRRFLAGDFKQLGPIVRSPVALKFGLDLSLMERIVKKIGVNHSRVFSLLDTYRAHPSILKLYNKTVYGDMLKSCCPRSSYDMERWSECPRKDGVAHPLIFHHCEGEETRTKDSPSWQNAGESDEVKKYLMKLLEFGVDPSDIGIISPYHKQCQRLNYVCKGEGVDVDVGTTELFQGREKRIIIISTVRSRQKDQIGADFRFSLGFLGSFKRTNVALSRAKSMLIVVGNLTLLSHDATWHNVIKLARDMGCTRGGRFELKKAIYGENSEWGQSGGLSQGGGGGDGVVDRPWRDTL